MAANSTGDFGHAKEMDPSDDELWTRSRAGDPDAFGLLFEPHAKFVYNYCFRRIGNCEASGRQRRRVGFPRRRF
jgi:hypothetical protein